MSESLPADSSSIDMVLNPLASPFASHIDTFSSRLSNSLRKHGYLQRKKLVDSNGKKVKNDKWTHMFVCLQENQLLFYKDHKSKEQGAEPVSVFCLLNVSICSVNYKEKKKLNFFQLTSPTGEQFYLQAETLAMMNDWYTVIQTAIDHTYEDYKKNPDKYAALVSSIGDVNGINDSPPPHSKFSHSRIDEDRQKLTVLMNKYKDQQTINYKSLKCSFIGPPRVGKTTTRMRLMEEIVNISSSDDTAVESTQLQKPLTVQMYERSDIAPAVLGSLHWKMDDFLGEMQLLLHHLQQDEGDPERQNPIGRTAEAQDDPKPTKKPMSTPLPIGEASGDKSKLMQRARVKMTRLFSRRGAQKHERPPLLTFDYVEKMMKEVLEKRGLKDIQDMEETVTAYIMDFGGQPEFQDIMPLVLSGPALHLVFFNASRGLNDPVRIKFSPQKGSAESCIEYDTRYTMSQMLFQILSSLYCLSKTVGNVSLPSGKDLPQFKPTAVLVGTHTDLNTSVDDVSATLERLFQDTEFWKNDFLCTPSGCKTIFYPLDNKHGTKEEIRDLQKFIKELILLRLRSTPMPRSWLLFHIALRHHHEQDGWCTMEQCVSLAAQCNIPKEDVEPILRYIHHHVGNVLHYVDVPGLHEKVFCEPNNLLQAVNLVIILAFVGDPTHPNLAKEIRKTGEVPGKLLAEIETRAAELPSITNKEVITLLKHFRIVTDIPGTGKIFVPCLLKPDVSIEMATQDQLKDVNPPPLLIQFEGGYIPVSVLPGLAVELVSRHKWILKTERRFQNHLTFVSPSSSCSVELIGHFHFLELRVVDKAEEPNSPPMHKCCVSVRKSFEMATASVLSSYEHTKEMIFALGFYCPCRLSGGSEPHFCEWISNTQMMCSKAQTTHSLGNGDIWFRESRHQPSDQRASAEGNKERGEKATLVYQVFNAPTEVRHTMGDVTFTHCNVGGFAGPGGTIGTVTQLQPPSESPHDATRRQQAAAPPERSVPSWPKTDPPAFASTSTAPHALPEDLDESHLGIIIGRLHRLDEWTALGLKLGMDYALLEDIDRDEGGDAEKCKVAMLHAWLRSGSATKSSLLHALGMAGKDDIAAEMV